MTTRALNVLLRVAILVVMLACAALFVDYSTATPSFCGVQSGCATVKTSAYSAILGVPLPHLGLGVFSGLFALAIWASRPRHHRALAMMAGLAGLGAVVFIGLQLFVIKAICKWCMMVDIGAIVAAVTAILLTRFDPPEEPLALRFLWAGLGVVVVAAPLMWPHPPPQANIPEDIARYYQKGKVNVVMFTDFECPFCRRMHPVVEELREQHPGKIHLVRLMRPLKGHPGAEPAALAYLCTPEAQRDAMADRLYEGSSEDLTPKGVVRIGKELGLDSRELAGCMTSKETRDALAAEAELFAKAELRGLPSLFVEQELVQGADVPAFEAATKRAIDGGGGGGAPVAWMFAFLGVLMAGVVAVSLRAAGQTPRAGSEAAV